MNDKTKTEVKAVKKEVKVKVDVEVEKTQEPIKKASLAELIKNSRQHNKVIAESRERTKIK